MKQSSSSYSEDFANEKFYGAPQKKEKETVTVTEETEEPEGIRKRTSKKNYSEQLKEISTQLFQTKKQEITSQGKNLAKQLMI